MWLKLVLNTRISSGNILIESVRKRHVIHYMTAKDYVIVTVV
jgi:hypothetical protein